MITALDGHVRKHPEVPFSIHVDGGCQTSSVPSPGAEDSLKAASRHIEHDGSGRPRQLNGRGQEGGVEQWARAEILRDWEGGGGGGGDEDGGAAGPGRVLVRSLGRHLTALALVARRQSPLASPVIGWWRITIAAVLSVTQRRTKSLRVDH